MSDTISAAPGKAEEAVPEPKNLVLRLTDGTAVKRRTLRQRACDEPAGKKICAGHLKRWYGFGEEIVEKFGREPEVYRCERCKILFVPNENEVARTGTLAF